MKHVSPLSQQICHYLKFSVNSNLQIICDSASERCYNREEVAGQISENGGTVVESPLRCDASFDDIFCISDGPCRKLKFLSSLAVGVPCVSYKFVGDCVKKVHALQYTPLVLKLSIQSIQNAM